MVTMMFENSMQLVNPMISLPYWDFTIEGGVVDTDEELGGDYTRLREASPLWTPDWFGGVDNEDYQVGFVVVVVLVLSRRHVGRVGAIVTNHQPAPQYSTQTVVVVIVVVVVVGVVVGVAVSSCSHQTCPHALYVEKHTRVGGPFGFSTGRELLLLSSSSLRVVVVVVMVCPPSSYHLLLRTTSQQGCCNDACGNIDVCTDSKTSRAIFVLAQVKDGRWGSLPVPIVDQDERLAVGADVYGRMRSPWNINSRPFMTRGLGEMCGLDSTEFCEFSFSLFVLLFFFFGLCCWLKSLFCVLLFLSFSRLCPPRSVWFSRARAQAPKPDSLERSLAASAIFWDPQQCASLSKTLLPSINTPLPPFLPPR